MRDHICTGVLVIGIPASLGFLLMSVPQIIVNARMAGYGDMALAGIGAAMKVTMMTGMVCIGFGQGVQPLLTTSFLFGVFFVLANALQAMGGPHHQPQPPGDHLYPGSVHLTGVPGGRRSGLGSAGGRPACYRSGGAAVPVGLPEDDGGGKPLE